MIIRNDRSRNGGGVAVYIKNNIPYSIRKDLISDHLEAICIEIKKPKSKPFLVATWYRTPSSKVDWFQDFENFL